METITDAGGLVLRGCATNMVLGCLVSNNPLFAVRYAGRYPYQLAKSAGESLYFERYFPAFADACTKRVQSERNTTNYALFRNSNEGAALFLSSRCDGGLRDDDEGCRQNDAANCATVALSLNTGLVVPSRLSSFVKKSVHSYRRQLAQQFGAEHVSQLIRQPSLIAEYGEADAPLPVIHFLPEIKAFEFPYFCQLSKKRNLAEDSLSFFEGLHGLKRIHWSQRDYQSRSGIYARYPANLSAMPAIQWLREIGYLPDPNLLQQLDRAFQPYFSCDSNANGELRILNNEYAKVYVHYHGSQPTLSGRLAAIASKYGTYCLLDKRRQALGMLLGSGLEEDLSQVASELGVAGLANVLEYIKKPGVLQHPKVSAANGPEGVSVPAFRGRM